jgi:hypothetical protein
LIANAIFMWGAFGAERTFSADGMKLMAVNAFFTLFSRFWFEEWLANRQAKTLKDGTVVVEAGQHSPKTTMRLRNIFEFANGLMKNLSLAQVPYVQWIFPAMGVAGVLKATWDKRHSTRRQLDRAADRLLGRMRHEDCRTLLVPR